MFPDTIVECDAMLARLHHRLRLAQERNDVDVELRIGEHIDDLFEHRRALAKQPA